LSNQEAAMLNDIYLEAKNRMRSAIQALEEDLSSIRTGRANPALVEKLSVEYYGALTPLQQLASIGVPEPRQLLIRPFDPATLKDIARAIQTSDLGLTPNSDGKVIRLILPPLTARVAVRNIRRDSIKDLREFENEKLISEDDLKRGEEEIQKITDDYISEINDTGDHKEAEIMEV
jgi:ribosome recycling factor